MTTRQCSRAFRLTNSSFLCQLRDSARAILKLMPADEATLATIRQVSGEAMRGKAGLLKQCPVTPSNSLNLYQLEVSLSMLLLVGGQKGGDEALLKLQLCLVVRASAVPLLLELLTSSTFLAARTWSPERLPTPPCCASSCSGWGWWGIARSEIMHLCLGSQKWTKKCLANKGSGK